MTYFNLHLLLAATPSRITPPTRNLTINGVLQHVRGADAIAEHNDLAIAGTRGHLTGSISMRGIMASIAGTLHSVTGSAAMTVSGGGGVGLTFGGTSLTFDGNTLEFT